MKAAYRTRLGRMYHASIEDFLESAEAKRIGGQVNLIFTSPPFPLASPKAYGNAQGEEYLEQITHAFARMKCLLAVDSSVVIEIGNAWNKGSPTMSTLPIRTLLAIASQCGFYVCQQFIWENPAKLPGPATWVNRQRIRVKDSHTNIWWFSLSQNPKASNRNVLTPYKEAQVKLQERGRYNSGSRPSQHSISETGFITDNGGAIPGSVLRVSNTSIDKQYRDWCATKELPMHPARMPRQVAEFFINLLTSPGDLVLDPYGGSNVTGRVAEDLERRWVSVESERDYVHGSEGRFKSREV